MQRRERRDAMYGAGVGGWRGEGVVPRVRGWRTCRCASRSLSKPDSGRRATFWCASSHRDTSYVMVSVSLRDLLRSRSSASLASIHSASSLDRALPAGVAVVGVLMLTTAGHKLQQRTRAGLARPQTRTRRTLPAANGSHA